MKDEKQKIECLFSKCQNQFIPKNTKTRFCSASHRVMWHRENLKEGTPKNDHQTSSQTQQSEKKEKTSNPVTNRQTASIAPKNGIKSFQDYIGEIPTLKGEETCNKWIDEVGRTKTLTPAQKTGLIARLKNRFV